MNRQQPAPYILLGVVFVLVWLTVVPHAADAAGALRDLVEIPVIGFLLYRAARRPRR